MFFPAAKVVVRKQDCLNKILLIKRTLDGKNFYEPAGGRINVNYEKNIAETLEECAHREAREELGVDVSIEKYIGSYYFFWSTDHKNGSSCAVFSATITQENIFSQEKNIDESELPFTPEWIKIESIIEKKNRINPAYIGLEKLMLNYCHFLLEENKLSLNLESTSQPTVLL